MSSGDIPSANGEDGRNTIWLVSSAQHLSQRRDDTADRSAAIRAVAGICVAV